MPAGAVLPAATVGGGMDVPEPSDAVAVPASRAPPPGPARARGRRGSRNVRRAALALTAVLAAEIVGTVGFHAIESVSWVNAFYFESMLATGQGPPFALNTNAGKIFASAMGFVSVGSTLTAVVFTLGPLVGRIWREGLERAEAGVRRLGHDAETELRHLEGKIP